MIFNDFRKVKPTKGRNGREPSMLTNLLLLIVFTIIIKKYFHGNKIDLNLFVAVSSVGFFLFFYLSLFLIQILRSNFFQFLVKKRCTQPLFFSPRFKQNASRHFASTPPQPPPSDLYHSSKLKGVKQSLPYHQIL